LILNKFVFDGLFYYFIIILILLFYNNINDNLFHVYINKLDIGYFSKGSSKSESVPLKYLVNGGPGSCSSTSKVAPQEGATTSEGEKPAAVLPSKEEEAKNLSVSKAEEPTNVEVVGPKTTSAVVEVIVCRKSQ